MRSACFLIWVLSYIAILGSLCSDQWQDEALLHSLHDSMMKYIGLLQGLLFEIRWYRPGKISLSIFFEWKDIALTLLIAVMMRSACLLDLGTKTYNHIGFSLF